MAVKYVPKYTSQMPHVITVLVAFEILLIEF